jgi:hypothetical protein
MKSSPGSQTFDNSVEVPETTVAELPTTASAQHISEKTAHDAADEQDMPQAPTIAKV